ncbi:xylose reductase [Dichotomocladium elegans]|nr:xylose reductase [Dichotomocladium elegans]
MSITTAEYLELHTGAKLPIVGFGTWPITSDDAENVVYNAIKAGYRAFDTAASYNNEVGIGRGIKKAISDGIVKREDLFVATKLWNTNHRKEHVRPAFERSLKDLGLDYIDLYYIHFPFAQKYVDPKIEYPAGLIDPVTHAFELDFVPLSETYHELEKLVDEGLMRHIGISNFGVQITLDVLSYARIRPAVATVELHAYLQRPDYVRWMNKQGIQVVAYSSFGSAGHQQFRDVSSKTPYLLQHPVVTTIATKHHKTNGQILLKHLVEKGIAVIPKSATSDRMRSNRDLFTWSLDDQDRADLNALDLNMRYNELEVYGVDFPLFD